MGALTDGGVTIHDMDILGAGSLFNAMAGVGQQLQKQIGQTGIPVYNVANACATGATAVRTVYLSIKAGEADMGLAVGVEQMGKGGLLGAGGKGDRGRKVYEPIGSVRIGDAGRGARSAPDSCPASSRRRAWSTRTRTTASASSSSPRSPRRTTCTRRSTRSRTTRSRSPSKR